MFKARIEKGRDGTWLKLQHNQSQSTAIQLRSYDQIREIIAVLQNELDKNTDILSVQENIDLMRGKEDEEGID